MNMEDERRKLVDANINRVKLGSGEVSEYTAIYGDCNVFIISITTFSLCVIHLDKL